MHGHVMRMSDTIYKSILSANKDHDHCSALFNLAPWALIQLCPVANLKHRQSSSHFPMDTDSNDSNEDILETYDCPAGG